MTTSAELGLPTLTVAPGGVATTTLTVRNGLDIVEAYSLEVVGDCAAWTTVEPARVSLYPGTSTTVTVRLAPPRSPAARAGEFPLGIRVLPTERPELVTVPETTVTVTPFQELQGAIAPRRRRGWLRGRYRTSVRNLGNAPASVVFTPGQAGEDLRFKVTPEKLRLEPGESGEVRVQARARKLIWFGKQASWPFEVAVGPEEVKPPGKGSAGQEPAGKESAGREPAATTAEAPSAAQRPVLGGEFLQLPIFPKWLLALLAALIALLLAWFALVRPAVRSSAKQAAEQAVAQQSATPGPATGGEPGAPAPGSTPNQGKPGAGQPSAGQPTTGGRGGSGPGGLAVPGTGQQSSATIDVQTANTTSSSGSYQVPHGKVFDITDIVAANFQGDQGLLTITAGKQTITTIALETFRNQDYHWVTPIQVPEDQAVTVNVTCETPGTPASGKQASTCHELLNISGALSDIRQAN
ncbi:hydrolytic protein [Streptomyces sp. SP17BM10]|uniref:COG1470 family protein n=1 Tax=Streptomyces sp. SP17BM10 TaxID=3002530 RepID=UPI002E7A7B28|nr:hydrolytic protein [Streptomyces sp. SP17BM10]MEE1783221.1 hydrolytic protein [Streptomyces sp. SP17BM10]